MNIKRVPNMLSVLRMALSLCLLLFLNDRAAYLAIFLLCGLTDVLDGVIARRANARSMLGARLDTAGDFLLFIILLASVIIWEGEAVLPYAPYAAGIVLIRIASLAVSAVRFKKTAGVHTWANKAAGLLIFAALGVYIPTGALWIFIPGCAAAAVSAAEELAILVTAERLDPDRKSIFVKQRRE
jgi:phosphatidylglycerophosphate synthase